MLDHLLLKPLKNRITFQMIALALIFVAFLVRIYRLDGVGLEGDEAFSIQAAYSGFSSILRLTATAEPHPPLYYSFLRVWYLLAGTSEFSLRFPSFIANVLTVAVLLRVASFFSWRSAGLVAAVFLILNPYQIWYAQEARMYAPVALCGLSAIFFCLRATERGSVGNLVAYSVFMLFSLYLHYYAIFLFGFTSLLFLATIWHRKQMSLRIKHYVGAQVIVAALFVPWLAYAYNISLSYTPFARGTLDLIGIAKESLVRYSLGISVPNDLGFELSLGFLVFGLIGLSMAGRGRAAHPAWFRYLFLAGYAFIPLGAGLLVSLLRPMFQARYLMVSAPAFYLMLGLGVVYLYKRLPVLGIASGLFMLSAELFSLNHYYFDPTYVKTDLPSAVAYIQTHARPGDAILLDGWSQTLQLWYYNTLKPKKPLPSYLFPLAESNGWELTPGKLDEIMHKHQGVWLLDYDVMGYDPYHIIESYLAKNYYQVMSHRVELNRTVYYASAPTAPRQSHDLNVSYNQELLLKSFSIAKPSVIPGDIVPLSLNWQSLKSVTKDYAVSWRLLDQNRHVVLQRDSGIASGFSHPKDWSIGEEAVDNYGMLVPASLLPGQYALDIAVYDKSSGATSQPYRDNKSLPQSLLHLANIEVVDAPPAASLLDPVPSIKASFGLGDLSLLGFDFAGGTFRPGDVVSVKLYWQASEDISKDYRLAERILDDKGHLVGEKTEGLAPSWFPTSRWQRGRVFTTYHDIAVPARTTSGDYKIALAVDADGVGESVFSVGPGFHVVSREKNFAVPTIAFPKSAEFGDLVELLGYDLLPSPEKPLIGGQEINLTLHWRALRETSESYKVFVHLVGEDGQIYGQKDAVPLDGRAPTNSWATGEVVSDNYVITVRPSAPPGKYRIMIGLYEEAKGTRIPLADGKGDSLVLGDLGISSSEK